MAEIPIREMEDNIDGSSKRLEPYPDYLKAELGLQEPLVCRVVRP